MAYTPNKVKSASEHRFKNQFKDNTFGGWAPATQAAEPARRSSPSALSPALPAPARQALGKKGERGWGGCGAHSAQLRRVRCPEGAETAERHPSPLTTLSLGCRDGGAGRGPDPQSP